MEKLAEIALFALGFAAMLRASSQSRTGTPVRAYASAAAAWAALMTKGLVFGAPQPLATHLGHGAFLAFAFGAAITVSIRLRKCRGS